MADPQLAGSGDAFLGGRLSLVQPGAGHRAGLDAVVLAAAAPVVAGDAVLDVGSGSGVVGLCIAERVPDCTVTGIEIDAELAALARHNAERNGLASRYSSYCADVTLPVVQLDEIGLRPGGFQVVVANPPYYQEGRVSESRVAGRRRASVMPEGGLETWVRFMTAMAAPQGALVLVHAASALGEMLAALEGRCGGCLVYPLFPRLGAPAHRILVSARKGSRAPLRLAQGMILHGTGNAFTDQAEAVLRYGAAIDLNI